MRDDRFLLAMIHALPDPVVGVDGDGRIRAWNGAAAATFGYGEDDAYGTKVQKLLGVDVSVAKPGRTPQKLKGASKTIDGTVDVIAVEGAKEAHHVVAMLVVRSPDAKLAATESPPPALTPPGFTKSLTPSQEGAAVLDADHEELPPRLRETLDGLCEGLAEKEIAAKLGLSPHTVHGYVKSVYKRFRVQSRAALVARILQQRTAAVAGARAS